MVYQSDTLAEVYQEIHTDRYEEPGLGKRTTHLTWCAGAGEGPEVGIESNRETPRCEDLDRATKASKTLQELKITGGTKLWLATPLLVDFTEFPLPDMPVFIPYTRSI